MTYMGRNRKLTIDPPLVGLAAKTKRTGSALDLPRLSEPQGI